MGDGRPFRLGFCSRCKAFSSHTLCLNFTQLTKKLSARTPLFYIFRTYWWTLWFPRPHHRPLPRLLLLLWPALSLQHHRFQLHHHLCHPLSGKSTSFSRHFYDSHFFHPKQYLQLTSTPEHNLRPPSTPNHPPRALASPAAARLLPRAAGLRMQRALPNSRHRGRRLRLPPAATARHGPERQLRAHHPAALFRRHLGPLVLAHREGLRRPTHRLGRFVGCKGHLKILYRRICFNIDKTCFRPHS